MTEYSTNLSTLNWTFTDGEDESRATNLARFRRQARAVVSPETLTASSSDGVAPATAALPKSILSNWSDVARSAITTELFERLVRIAAQPDGWQGPGSRSLRALSLKQFLAFWKEVRDAAVEPELALSPDGSLHAEWYRSDRQRLDLSFREPQVLFGLFANKEILEGAQSLQSVADILKAHRLKPLEWGRV